MHVSELIPPYRASNLSLKEYFFNLLINNSHYYDNFTLTEVHSSNKIMQNFFISYYVCISLN